VRRADGVLERHLEDGPPRARASGAEAAARLRASLARAVASAVAPHRRVGILLSGGLDSASVAAAAAAAWRDLDRDPRDLRLYHWVPARGPSERVHAERVAAHLGLPLTVLPDDDDDPFEGTGAYLRACDMPPDGGGARPLLLAVARAREDGVTTILTGDGGDEAVTGELVRPWRRDRRVRSTTAFLAHVARAAVRPLSSRLRPASAARRARERGVPDWLAERLRDVPAPNPFPAARRGLRGAAAERDRALRSGRQTLIVSCVRAAARTAGIEAAIPFLDADVEDAVVSTPPRHFLGDRGDKALLRRAMANDLPTEVLERPKDQPRLEPLLADLARRHADGWLERYVLPGALVRDGLVPAEAARDLLARGASGSVEALVRAMGIVALSAWCVERGL
jgi:asparagine synthase (glutamine-hydrolysing)